MKVQLERKIPTCPEQLGCVVCQQKFTVPNIRSLLCTDAGLIQGDVCPTCLKLKADGIKHKMRERSGLLLKQAELDQERSLSLRQRALELLAASQEDITLPTLFTWMGKRLEILAQETQELEAARFGTGNSCACRKRSRLRIVFEEDGFS
jgi:hypothetical protein